MTTRKRRDPGHPSHTLGSILGNQRFGVDAPRIWIESVSVKGTRPGHSSQGSSIAEPSTKKPEVDAASDGDPRSRVTRGKLSPHGIVPDRTKVYKLKLLSGTICHGKTTSHRQPYSFSWPSASHRWFPLTSTAALTIKKLRL